MDSKPRLEGVMLDFNWNEIEDLQERAHVHLEECLESSPPPGAGEWLDIVAELVPKLVELGGAWVITVPLGHIRSLPTAQPRLPEELLELADPGELVEPPAVHRLPPERIAHRWEGESHSWKISLSPTVIQTVRIDRSIRETRRDEPFSATVSFEISPE
jgi:hypothetical protein